MLAAIEDLNFNLISKLKEVKNNCRKRIEVYRTYNELNKLSDRELKDIGLQRCNLFAVASATFSEEKSEYRVRG